jgi:type I restriction enzyme S subunit
MSSEVPEGWRLAKLGEIAALSGGTTPPKSNDAYWTQGEVPWATPSDITSLPLGQTRIADTEAHVAKLALEKCSLRLNPTGTVLMTSRATIGYAVINDVPMATNQGFLNFTCSDDCDPRFLCHWLNANRGLLTAAAGGSTFKELSRGTAKLLPIPLPPRDEQRRIAEVLRSVDDVLQAADGARHAANSVFRASLDEMLDGDASDWPTSRLGQVAEFINGRGFKPHEWESTGLPIIRIQNLNGSTEFNFYSGAYNPKIRVSTGELLFAWSGSRGTSFGPHIWKGPEGLLNYHTWKVVPKSKSDAQFLYFSLLRLTKQIEEEAHGASALVHTQKATIVDYETGWPSREVRMEVASTLSEMEDARSAANVAFEQARALRQHIASDLLSGRVRVPA